jgi:hypothetical protein
LDADITHLIQLLKNDRLDPPYEESVYRAVMIWVRHDETNRKHLLPDLLQQVRLVFTSKKFLLQEVMLDPLISSSPESIEIAERVMRHFNYKYGDSISMIITNAKPRIKYTNRLNIDNMRYLRYYDCSETSNYSTREQLDLSDYFKDIGVDHHFLWLEWFQSMDQNNFLTSFREGWKGKNDTGHHDENSGD